jgi:hypothetical protein
VIGDATYTLKIEYAPEHAADSMPWWVTIRSTDSEYRVNFWASSRDDGIEAARSRIKAQADHKGPETLYLDANGDLVPQSHRVDTGARLDLVHSSRDLDPDDRL